MTAPTGSTRTTAPAESESLQALKREVCAAIDRRGEELVRIADDIYHHPELGFKETRTAAIVAGY
ncbi:MAG TPA: amidohydrolase, partial [Chloroflexota bacterium]|nr:amidohydrolase [Chloroflexota bacterium]